MIDVATLSVIRRWALRERLGSPTTATPWWTMPNHRERLRQTLTVFVYTITTGYSQQIPDTLPRAKWLSQPRTG